MKSAERMASKHLSWSAPRQDRFTDAQNDQIVQTILAWAHVVFAIMLGVFRLFLPMRVVFT